MDNIKLVLETAEADPRFDDSIADVDNSSADENALELKASEVDAEPEDRTTGVEDGSIDVFILLIILVTN